MGGGGRGESPALTTRQQYILGSARSALTQLERIRRLAAQLTPQLLANLVLTRVAPHLPPGARLAPEMRLAPGTCSGGFVDDDGTMYVDLTTVCDLANEPEALHQFLAHETWHACHFCALEGHPRMAGDGFMLLAALQSEGMVGYLIGGTYERCRRLAAEAAEEPVRQQAARFVAYFDSMDAYLGARLAELWAALEQFLSGHPEGYVGYQRSLPDMPANRVRALTGLAGSDVTVAGFPAANTAAITELTGVGFMETGRPLRMVRGGRLAWKPDLLWRRFNGAIG